jgi:hypothetical protein
VVLHPLRLTPDWLEWAHAYACMHAPWLLGVTCCKQSHTGRVSVSPRLHKTAWLPRHLHITVSQGLGGPAARLAAAAHAYASLTTFFVDRHGSFSLCDLTTTRPHGADRVAHSCSSCRRCNGGCERTFTASFFPGKVQGCQC